MPFLAFLQKIFHPVLRILGMSADPPNTDEFPKRMSVEDWRRGLVNMYTSRDLELGPKYCARMPTLQVTRIRRYKERKSPRHEYLVAEIAVPESERRYLRLERSARDSFPAESNGANKEVFHPISNGSQSSLAISSNLAAMDDVRTITGWPIDSCIDKVDCENLPEPITLLDLALAAELVHNNSDKYQIISRQCFWYADTVSAVLETCFPNVKIQYRPKLADADVNHNEDGEDGVHDENSGKFLQFSFHRRQQGDVDQIVEVFHERKSTITDSVCFFLRLIQRVLIENLDRLQLQLQLLVTHYECRKIQKEELKRHRSRQRMRKGRQRISEGELKRHRSRQRMRKSRQRMRKGRQRMRKSRQRMRKGRQRILEGGLRRPRCR